MEEFLPIIAAVLGVLVSWALSSGSPAVAWFGKLPGWGKLGVIVGISVVYGLALYFGLEADLVEAIKQVLILLLGTQVGYVMKPSGEA